MIRVGNEEIKICIVNVYFGAFPNYFPLWLKSAQRNPNIDFLIFSDGTYANLPSNVRIVHSSLADIKQRAEKALGFEVALDTPYKCCDYKAIYGLIFKEELNSYNYWGHCDLDLIWGDLEKCFIENEITRYDRFFFLGHLSLYRNNDTVNNYIKLPGAAVDYREVFTTNRICVFDEVPGTVQIYLKHGLPMFSEKKFADVSSIYRRFRLAKLTITKEKIQNYHRQVFIWKDGCVYRLYCQRHRIFEEEYAYIHFKKRPNFTLNFNWQSCSSFAIIDAGFFPVDGLSPNEIIARYARCRSVIAEGLEYSRYLALPYLDAVKRRLTQLFENEKGNV